MTTLCVKVKTPDMQSAASRVPVDQGSERHHVVRYFTLVAR